MAVNYIFVSDLTMKKSETLKETLNVSRIWETNGVKRVKDRKLPCICIPNILK
jgi:histidine ammonia-lyase